ncbi:MAG: NAD-dependent epimerase/dehydratase family protein [Saprospiraceae bacterium]|nr:NAD-dependent epimerase/dehydratase family protein [Saprospiraceae bacterium]
MQAETVLVIGANGQIGTVLAQALRGVYGENNVIASDLRPPAEDQGLFEILDVLDGARLLDIVQRYKVSQIYHLAAILSAKGEQDPKRAWEINMSSLFNVLEIAKDYKLRVFFPSSIAVYGAHTPRENTPQFTIREPSTVYGISKVAGENWCNYYHLRYGLDVRSIRYPGIIGYQSLPGGGTTDYAVDIYHKAVQGQPFECFLSADTMLPMLYMDDAIRATLELMFTDPDKIQVRTSYNLAGMSFSPAEVAASIQKHIPDFSISYKPDFRQAIADSWPQSIDDSKAREEWGWKPRFDLEGMTVDMLLHLRTQYGMTNYE